MLNIKYFLHLRSTVFHVKIKFMRDFFLSQGKRKGEGVFRRRGKKRKKELSLFIVQGWDSRMAFQCEVLQTAKIHCNSGHSTYRKYKSAWDFSKKRESLLPTEHFRGWRELWHCTWQTAKHCTSKIQIFWRTFTKGPQVSQNSSTHFTHCNTAQTKIKSDIWRIQSGFYHHFTKVHLFARASEESEYNTLASRCNQQH